MKIALIGDIHANLPALEAVLTHAAGLHVDQVWNIGDSVGYGAFPDQVVTRISQADILNIRGNYDRKVLEYPEKHERWQGKKPEEKIKAFGWAFQQLSAANRKYLAGLPEERELDLEGHHILITHASPVSRKEHLGPGTSIQRLEEISAQRPVDVAIFGHSHQPFVRKAGVTWFINTGSVGRPDDGDPRACYAYLVLEPGSIGVCHIRVDYDIQRAVAEIRKQNLPEDFVAMIAQGRSLDQVNSNV